MLWLIHFFSSHVKHWPIFSLLMNWRTGNDCQCNKSEVRKVQGNHKCYSSSTLKDNEALLVNDKEIESILIISLLKQRPIQLP